jgi:hypothetical protein
VLLTLFCERPAGRLPLSAAPAVGVDFSFLDRPLVAFLTADIKAVAVAGLSPGRKSLPHKHFRERRTQTAAPSGTVYRKARR